MAKDLAQIYIRAKDETGGAFDSVKRGAQGVSESLGRVNGLLAGLGVGVSAGAFAALVKHSIDATGALNDLKDSTALTVETLSGLQQSARIFNTDFNLVTTTAQKFARSVGEAAGGNVELLRSFNALGISQERLRAGKFDELFTEFAGKIANAENKTYAIAYATELAGKSAANALPFFKDLSEAGLAQATVSAEQAAAADKLGDEIGRLKNEAALFAESVGVRVVPVLLEWIEKTKSAADATGGLVSGLNALAQLPQFGDNAVEQIRRIDEELAKIEKRRGMFDGGFLKDSWQAAFGMRESGLLSLRAVAQAQLKARGYGQYVGDTGLPTPGGLALPPPPAAAGPKDTSFQTLLEQLRQKAQLDKDATESEKLLFELSKERYAKLTLAQKAELEGLAKTIDAKMELAAANKYNAEQIARADAAQASADKVLADFNRTQFETLDNLQFETSLITLNESQREQAIALRKLEQEYLKSSIQLVGEETDAYSRRMEVTRGIYEQQRSALPGAVYANVAAREAIEQQKKLTEEAKRQHEEISRSLTDALLRGFESGKGFAENFRDSVKNMFSTLVLRPIIQPIAQGAAGALGGVLGGLGVPGYTGGTFGGGAIGAGIGQSLIGNGISSLFGSIGSGLFGTSTAYASALGLSSAAAGSQAALLASQTGVFGASGLASTAAAGGAAGAGALVSALPYIGLALGAAALLGGGSKGGPASFTGLDVSGTAGAGGLISSQFFGNSANSKQGFRWESFDHGATGGINDLIAGAFTDIGNIADTLGLDKSRLASAQAGFSFRVTEAGNNGAGPTTQEVINAFGRNLGQVTDQLANTLMPNLKEFAQANESATQTLVRLVQVQEQLRASEEQIKGQLAGAVRELPGQLGITSLEGARNALAVSDYQSPLSRLGAARSLLDDTYQRGLAGDLTAVNSFGSQLQQVLSIGRDVGASGPAFQALFVEGNRQLNELLAKQQSVQQEILQGIDVSILQSAQDQVGELRRGFKAVVDQLTAVQDELRRIRAAA